MMIYVRTLVPWTELIKGNYTICICFYFISRFLTKPAMYFDDILFAVGKICNHLITYLTFHQSK